VPLREGTIGGPVTGVYFGAETVAQAGNTESAAVAIPPSHTPANVTFVTFLADGVNSASFEVAASAGAIFRIVPLSPGNTTLALAGEWWDLKEENVDLEVMEGSKVVRKETLFTGGQTGQRMWTATSKPPRRSDDTVELTTFVFRKYALH
jgi:hypothetical protein